MLGKVMTTLITLIVVWLFPDVVLLCHKHTQRGNISAWHYLCKQEIACRGKSNSCGGILP